VLFALTLLVSVSIDPFTEIAYFAQEPAQALSTTLTVRQRNDGTGFALQAVGPCKGVVDFSGRHVTCGAGVSDAYTTFMREGISKQKALTPSQKELRGYDVLVGQGKLKEARKGYHSLMKRGLANVARVAEIADAEMCWRLDSHCDSLDAFEPQNAEERERLAILRLTQSKPQEALKLAEGLHSMRAMVLREHALAMAVRETFLSGDDLGLIALYYRHEAAVNAHGDARELRLLVLHAFYEIEADDALRAFVRPGDVTLGMLPAEVKSHE
jgi:hypothetical protein